jgi:hypothetical protein
MTTPELDVRLVGAAPTLSLAPHTTGVTAAVAVEKQNVERGTRAWLLSFIGLNAQGHSHLPRRGHAGLSLPGVRTSSSLSPFARSHPVQVTSGGPDLRSRRAGL